MYAETVSIELKKVDFVGSLEIAVFPYVGSFFREIFKNYCFDVDIFLLVTALLNKLIIGH